MASLLSLPTKLLGEITKGPGPIGGGDEGGIEGIACMISFLQGTFALRVLHLPR
jgi:hypothetical protein